MDTVINKLWEIEEAAGAIADEANVRKKAFAKEMEDKTASLMPALNRKQPTGLLISGIRWKQIWKPCLPGRNRILRHFLNSWKIIITVITQRMQMPCSRR